MAALPGRGLSQDLQLLDQQASGVCAAGTTLSLNASRDGDSTSSLGSPFQCIATVSEDKLFLTFNLNLP